MSFIIFDTQRLLGRHIESSDADAMLAVYGDAETMRYVGNNQPLSAGECKSWIEIIFKKYQQWGYGMSAIVRKSSKEVVGFCGLVHPHDQIETEVKYALRRDCWGEGIATEAITALLAYGRRELMIKYMTATVNPSNLASQRVLDKAGMNRGPLRLNADGSFTQMYTLGLQSGSNEA